MILAWNGKEFACKAGHDIQTWHVQKQWQLVYTKQQGMAELAKSEKFPVLNRTTECEVSQYDYKSLF